MAISTNQDKADHAQQVGVRIKKARQRKGLNQNQLGLAIGCNGQRVAEWEKGTSPTIHFVVALSKVLDESVQWIVTGKRSTK